jgi:hypothetical protein
MNLLQILLYAFGAITLFLLGLYLGYRLTRNIAFNKILEPAIRKAFSQGYTAGFEAGQKDLLLKLSSDVPLTDEAILQFMREISDAQQGIEPAPLASVNWAEEPQEQEDA